jgi:hypothetical protein
MVAPEILFDWPDQVVHASPAKVFKSYATIGSFSRSSLRANGGKRESNNANFTRIRGSST